MKKKYQVLIVEDESLIIDSYRRALRFVEEDLVNIKFNITEALDCGQAIDKIRAIELNNNKFDIAFLDINLPSSKSYDILNGEVLGQVIIKKNPSCKLLVCTSYTDNHRLKNILTSLNPNAFLIKSDIVFLDLVVSITKLVENDSYYSKTVIDLMRKQLNSAIVLDDLDLKILHEMSNGAKMKDLIALLPLTKSGLEKRRAHVKVKFGNKFMSDRDMIIAAKTKGFI
ncbi:response regulator transcription factor [Gaetbulibacter sp. PBL-D1]|uniref:response regulator transcription factor n=1 Tax=Gaetbulibacter sp. PBL-D1 TaxID=3422594 RepID=UPI003D2EAAB7